MPLKVSNWVPVPKPGTADIVPDIRTDKPIPFRVFISQEIPLLWPENFDQLPKEEQERIASQYRFQGIRMRSDIKNKTVPLSRETMDIP